MSIRTCCKLIPVLLFLATKGYGQDSDINTRLESGELKMTFPSIYFKHNSTDYATMPYPVDSCFKLIAARIKELNSYPVWRDTDEKERLTIIRIQKLKSDLNKFVDSRQIHFQSMGTAQKISVQTIEKGSDDTQKQYLRSLNSVLDVSGAINKQKKLPQAKKQKKGIPRLVWCGWKYGFHWSSNGGVKKNSKTSK